MRIPVVLSRSEVARLLFHVEPRRKPVIELLYERCHAAGLVGGEIS
jgi:hypothetical protein